jgi:DNA-binding SARP family transcriptional activator/streptogramin lyase
VVEDQLEFRILGPLAVERGNPVPVGAGREAALLGALLLRPNRTVSTDSLIEALWDEEPPASAREMIRIYVARLRKDLRRAGAGDAIATAAGGYAINVGDGTLDASRFEQLRAEGLAASAAGDAERAVTTLAQAAALWRGATLAHLELFGYAHEEIRRLEELRIATIEARIDGELELGQGQELVAELGALIREHPYRERLRASLMLTLYRGGRQTESLAAYRDASRTLLTLGLEPGPELRELERSILSHDPSLLAPVATVNATAATTRRPRFTHRSRAIALLAVAATLGVVLVAVLLPRGGAPLRPQVESVVVVDPSQGRAVKQLALGSIPGAIAIEGRHLWVVNPVDRTISEFDATTLRHLRTIGLSTEPYRLVAERGELWLGNAFDGTLTRLDVGTGVLSPPFRPEPRSIGRVALLRAFGSLWVGSQDNIVARLDPRTDDLQATIPGVDAPEDLTATSDAVWAVQARKPIVLELSPSTNRIIGRIHVTGHPVGLATEAGSPWVLTADPARLWRIDPTSRRVGASVPLGANPSGVTNGMGRLWVVNAERGTLTEIDPLRARIVRTTEIAQPLGGIVAGAGRLWLTIP